MDTTKPISEVELEAALRDDIEFAFYILHSEFRHDIARYIKSRAYALTPADIKDVYQQTMVEFVNVVRKPGFDFKAPLRIVFDIAGKRAIDALRKKKYNPKMNIDGALPLIAKKMKGTRLESRWKSLDKIIRVEFFQALHDSISNLPPKLQIVARAFVENYEEFGERQVYGPLARAVSEIVGTPVNVVTVKTQWLDARSRITQDLIKKGYGDLLSTE